MSITTLVTFVEVFDVDLSNKRRTKHLLQNAKREPNKGVKDSSNTIVFNGKIGSIFREKNQTKQVSAGLECGITLKDFGDFQKNDIIEVYNSKITERRI